MTVLVRRFAATTRTAEDAAREIGTEVGRIVKSLVFIADGSAVVALCSGSTRVDEAQLALALKVRAVRRANAEEAKTFTGFSIGGVPPFGHDCGVVMDESLLAYEVVWAAAGLPDAVFPIAPRDLARVAEARVAPIAR